MARNAYLVLHWDRAEASADDTTRLIRCQLGLDASGEWRLSHQSPGLWVFTHVDRPAMLRRVRGGLIIGDLFDVAGALAPDPVPGQDQPADPLAVASVLASRFWGRYVAIFPGGQVPCVFRDPIGGLECVAWRRKGVTIAASHLPDPLLLQFGDGLTLDWARLGQIAADTTQVAGAPALTGLVTVEPGVLARFPDGPVERHRIWAPSQIALSGPPETDPARALEATIDRCVAAWAGAYPKVLAELSGGLDSAVVAAALSASAAGPIIWFNQYIDDPGGDERPFARAMARRLGVALKIWRKPPMVFSPSDFETNTDSLRPSFNGSDAPSDRELARRVGALGADAIFTGQGGDIVLYQLTTPLVAADTARRLGLRALTPKVLTAIAAWNRISVWSVLRAVWFGGGRGEAAQRPEPVVRPRQAAPPPPWMSGASALPPGKRFQLRHLTYCPVFFGASHRSAAAALIHPLLSQPVVELCLRLPSDILTEGAQGRGLVRRAFKARLARKVVQRRTKADMTRFYGHALADGLEAIRPYLLDGRLSQQRIVDRGRLDARLTPEALARDGHYGDIVDLLVLEAWARRWSDRLDRIAAMRATLRP